MLLNQGKQHHVRKCLIKLNLKKLYHLVVNIHLSNFKAEREIGNDLLTVENLSVKIDGETILDNISFILRPGDKTALIGQMTSKRLH